MLFDRVANVTAVFFFTSFFCSHNRLTGSKVFFKFVMTEQSSIYWACAGINIYGI